MRKLLTLAIAAVACMAVTSVAQADQTITGSVQPSKLDKKKKKNVKLVIDIQTEDLSAASEQPPDADRTVVDFPKNLSFDPKAVPNCKGEESELQATDTDTAIGICGKDSIVSVPPKSGTVAATDIDGRAVSSSIPTGAVVIADTDPLNPGGLISKIPVTVTAFNGTKPNTLYLHSRASVGITNVLVGKLKKGKGKYGNSLDITIPQLLAGGIADFKTTVKNGKYVQAVCKTTKMPYGATTYYSDAPTTSATFDGKCTQKKKK